MLEWEFLIVSDFAFKSSNREGHFFQFALNGHGHLTLLQFHCKAKECEEIIGHIPPIQLFCVLIYFEHVNFFFQSGDIK